jgi:cytochrome c oxidase subunit IV
MSDSHHGHAAGGHAEEHHGSTALYLMVTGALCVLTLGSFLTYWDGFRLHVPVPASRLFMMAIAVTKASLVMLFFMHLKWEAVWKYVLTIPSIIMAIFLMLALVPDVGLRRRHYSEERQINAAAPRAATTAHPSPSGH